MTGYPSKDKPWLKYYKPDVEKTAVPHHSIYQAIKESNKNRLNRIALDLRNIEDDYKLGVRITYAQFFERIDRIARSYAALGVKPNDCVVSVLPNIPESRILIYGLNAIGATVYPASPMMASSQLSQVVKESNAKHIVMFIAFFEKFENVFSDCSFESVVGVTGKESYQLNEQDDEEAFNRCDYVFADIPNFIKWRELERLKKSDIGTLKPYYSSDHVAIIVGTSGTTGTPKGVCLTDDNLNAVAIQFGLSGMLDDVHVILDALIQSIGYGIATMHYSAYYGCQSILIPELLTDRFPEVLCRIKPDHFPGGPVHCQYLINSKEFRDGKVPEVKNLISGGASLPFDWEKTLNDVAVEFEEEGTPDPRIRVRQGYGMTENGGCGTYGIHGAYKFGGLGIPLPLDTVGIFKMGTDEEVKCCVEGEVCISGPTVMKGYLHNREETELVLKKHSDGEIWLHTADIGMIDEDGQLFLTGRAKDIFMRNGFNIHPSVIEKYIDSLPFVQECKIVGIKHDEEQMVPVAFVVLSQKIQEENRESLISTLRQLCFENLDELYVPYKWFFVDAMPRNLGGKIDVDALKNTIKTTLANEKY